MQVETKGRHVNITYASGDDFDAHLQSSIADDGCKRKLTPFKEDLAIKIELTNLKTLDRNAYTNANRMKSLLRPIYRIYTRDFWVIFGLISAFCYLQR